MCSEISKDNIKYYLRSPDDHEDFVFISYRKENYNDVINGIVLEMCKKYKLKIYFDYNFDKKKELWIEQAKEVISSKYCRALIAFINTAYYTSFATLFEIMATQTARANDICVIPVQLEEPNFSKFDEKDTGLGMYDKTNKNNKETELKLFNKDFKEILRKYEMNGNGNKKVDLESYYMNLEDLDKPEYTTARNSGKYYLNTTNCYNIMGIIMPPANLIKKDTKDTNEVFIDKIYEKLHGEFPSVFIKETDNKEEIEKEEKRLEEKTENKSSTIISSDIVIKPADKTYHIFGKMYDAYYRIDKDKYIILRGSKVNINEQWTPKTIYENNKEFIQKDGTLIKDIVIDKISTAAKFIKGQSTAGKELLNKKNLLKEDFVSEISTDDKSTENKSSTIISSDIVIKPADKTYHISGNKYDAYYRIDKDKFIILKGSKVNFNNQWIPKTIYENNKEFIKDGTLIKDIIIDKISTAAKFIKGQSTAGKELLNKKNLLKEDFVLKISKDDKSTGKEKVSEDNEKIQKSEEKVVSSGISGPVDLNSTKKN